MFSSQFYPNNNLCPYNDLQFTLEVPVTSLEQYYGLQETWNFLKKYDPIFSLCKFQVSEELDLLTVDDVPLYLCHPNESITIYTRDKVFVEEDLLLDYPIELMGEMTDFGIMGRRALANSDKEANKILNKWHQLRDVYHRVWNESDLNKQVLMLHAQYNVSEAFY